MESDVVNVRCRKHVCDDQILITFRKKIVSFVTVSLIQMNFTKKKKKSVTTQMSASQAQVTRMDILCTSIIIRIAN